MLGAVLAQHIVGGRPPLGLSGGRPPEQRGRLQGGVASLLRKGDHGGTEKTIQKCAATSILVRVVVLRNAAVIRPNRMQQSNWNQQRILLFVLEGHRVGMHDYGLRRQLRCNLESGFREYGCRQRLEYRIINQESRLQCRHLAAERQCIFGSLWVDEKPTYRILRR
jgi:hypothetical protein